jgi:hypothetical protein
MRWHEQSLVVKGLPDGEILLIGILEESVLRLDVEFWKNDKCYTITEWSKSLRMWRSQEILNEEVREKYWDKIIKIKSRHESFPYSDWLYYFTSKLNPEERKELLG